MKPIFVLPVFGILIGCTGCSAGHGASGASDGLLEGVAAGKTRVVDLTHALNAQTPYWPGDGNKPFRFEYFTSLKKDGFLEGHFTMDEHTGTHFDAPNHFIAGQLSSEKIPPDRFIVPAAVIDIRKQSADADYLLTTGDIAQWEKENGRIPANAMVMLHTGWDAKWADFTNFKNADNKGVLHFPGFGASAAQFLVAQRNIAGLGTDALSIDCGRSVDFPAHMITHSQGKYNIENIANLGELPPNGAFLVVAPIKIEGGTGGPVRLFALFAAPAR